MTNDMKSIFKIASVYAGTILGAGFASGQEINQFFITYGYKSIYGILLSGLLFIIIGIVVLNKIYCKRIHTYQQYIFPLIGKKAGRIVEILSYLFMLSTFYIMVAGSGALFNEQFNTNKMTGIIIMAVLCLIVFLNDIKGIVTINSLLTPIMVTGIIFLGFYILIFNDTDVISIKHLIKGVAYNWFTSSILYVSYNTLTLTAVMTAIYPLITKQKVAVLGGLIGGSALLLCALILWFIIMAFRLDILPYEIPMLYIAMQKGKIIEYIYVFILYSAMLTTAVANGYGFLNQITTWTGWNKKLITIVFCILSIPLGKIGFSNLVKMLYSLFGYLGLSMLTIIIIDGLKESCNIKQLRNCDKTR